MRLPWSNRLRLPIAPESPHLAQPRYQKSRFYSLCLAVPRARLLNEARNGRQPPVHSILGKVEGRGPAPLLGLSSFPQAIAGICERDAGNAKKIQDIVVCC